MLVKKIILFLIYYLIINVSIFTDCLQLELIKKMNANLLTEKNYDRERLTMHRTPAGPSCFTLNNNLFYIPDDWRKRFVVYDLNMKFIKEIIIEPMQIGILGAQRIEILKNKILIISNSIVSYNMDGTVQYSKKYNTNDHWNFFIIDNNLYYYTIDNKIEGIDDEGNILNEEAAINKLKNGGGWQKGIFNKYEQINNKVINFVQKNHILFYNDKLFYWQYDEYHEEYYDLLKKANINNSSIDKKYLLRLIGFDNNNNSYWKVLDRNYFTPRHLCILNKDGKIIQWTDDILFRATVQVNINGDIYLMFTELSDKTYSFYRIRNIWDPIDTIKTSIAK